VLHLNQLEHGCLDKEGELNMKAHETKSKMCERAVEALRQLLGEVSTIRLKEIRHESPTKTGKAEILVDLDVFGRSHALVCVVKSSAEPADLRKELAQLRRGATAFASHVTPVLIAPFLPMEVQAICNETSAGFLDFQGNARIAVGEVFIGKRTLRRGSDRPSMIVPEAFEAPASSAVRAALNRQPSHFAGGAVAIA
jgi:hypothetical protein